MKESGQIQKVEFSHAVLSCRCVLEAHGKSRLAGWKKSLPCIFPFLVCTSSNAV